MYDFGTDQYTVDYMSSYPEFSDVMFMDRPVNRIEKHTPYVTSNNQSGIYVAPTPAPGNETMYNMSQNGNMVGMNMRHANEVAPSAQTAQTAQSTQLNTQQRIQQQLNNPRSASADSFFTRLIRRENPTESMTSAPVAITLNQTDILMFLFILIIVISISFVYTVRTLQSQVNILRGMVSGIQGAYDCSLDL